MASSPTTGSVGISSAAKSSSVLAGSRVMIDAGVVFADREGYLCVGLEQVGLAADASIGSIKTSCECVQPSLVTYATTSGTEERGVLLRFLAEASRSAGATPAGDDAAAPVNLGVLVDLKLADGSTHAFTVSLLHTSLLQEAAL